jgi:hypothetical protein
VCLLAALGSGCAKSTVVLTDTETLCRDWRVFRPLPADKLTDKSAEELLEGNEARVVYGCAQHENAAAS